MASAPVKIEIYERDGFYSDFPKLDKNNHKVTSPATPSVRSPKSPYHIYNCFGMAVGDETRVWWPGGRGYWPKEPSEDTIDELMLVLANEFGYRECADASFEDGIRKLAIFADAQNVPQHVAFQPQYTGSTRRRWKSKIGKNVNMEHSLWAIEGKLYGTARVFMCRQFP